MSLALLALLALAGLLGGCGGSTSAQSRSIAISAAGWESLASDMSLAALRRDAPQIGDCKLSVAGKHPKTMELTDCRGGRRGTITQGGPRRAPTCSEQSGTVRCSVQSGVRVTVEAPRPGPAAALLKQTIEVVNAAIPDKAAVWGTWLEPSLNEPKGSLTLASPRHVAEANVKPCAAGRSAAAMLGRLEVSKRTARHVAGRGVHLLMIEKPTADRSFSMSINGECRRSRAGVLRGPAIEMTASRMRPFVLVIPGYYSGAPSHGRRERLRGLMLEPRLYRGERRNQLPGTMLAQPEDREATAGQVPLISSAWAEG